MARLARLLRLLRLLETMQGFESLYLLTGTLKGSMSALMWSGILLLAIQLTTALMLNQLLEGFLLDAANPLEQRREVCRYFGTVSRATFTVFELTLGNFGPIGRCLMENVGEWCIVFSILHKCSIGFALVSIFRGVFLHETIKVASLDDSIMLSQRKRAKEVHSRKMERLFALVNQDGDDHICLLEFRAACKDPLLMTWLESMELSIHDAD